MNLQFIWSTWVLNTHHLAAVLRNGKSSTSYVFGTSLHTIWNGTMLRCENFLDAHFFSCFRSTVTRFLGWYSSASLFSASWFLFFYVNEDIFAHLALDVFPPNFWVASSVQEIQIWLGTGKSLWLHVPLCWLKRLNSEVLHSSFLCRVRLSRVFLLRQRATALLQTKPL